MSENISQLDRDVLELIWDAGREKRNRDGDKSFKRTNEQEIESCMRENPQIQKLQDTYQAYLQNPNKSNKDILSNLVTYIKNPTAKNQKALEKLVYATSVVNVRA